MQVGHKCEMGERMKYSTTGDEEDEIVFSHPDEK